MPRKKWIDKNNPNTQTFHLLYRPQNDPLLNDENAGDRALFPLPKKGETSSRSEAEDRGLHLADLENELDFESMRENEGEAAEHGIYFDDTSYDYMQHLRDLGDGGGQSHFVDAVPNKIKGKGKAKNVRLEDALREISLDEDDNSEAPSLVDSHLSTFSRSTRQRTYQDQQDVPDDIAGFQPDMDPRLREVLEALEDDAYVDDKDEEDVFGELARDGKGYGELPLEEFQANFEDDEGWESDVTEKASYQPKELKMPSIEVSAVSGKVGFSDSMSFNENEAAAAAAAEDGDWLRDFAKYKRDTTKNVPPKVSESITAGSAVHERAPTLYTLNGTPLRQKKRKGALTNPSAYSMTSSSLARTDGQQLLDARFDQVEKMYSLDEGDEYDDTDGAASLVSGMTGMSKQSKMSTLSTTSFADPGAVRGDFDGMMDDFLGDWNKANPGGKRRGAKGKRGKNGNEVFGLQQLEEVRAELGPARLYRKVQKA